ATPSGAPSSPAAGPDDRDSRVLDGPATVSAFEREGSGVVNDPLIIGGQFYLRAQGTLLRGTKPADSQFNAPTFVDAFMDARPGDHVRGYVSGRVTFDPSTQPLTSLSAN